MSCTRNAWGSSSDAKLSATSSAIAARLSGVARSAARPTMATCSVARRSAGRPRVGGAATEVIPLRRREDLSPPKGLVKRRTRPRRTPGLVRPSAQSHAADINGRAASRRRVDGLHDLDASTALFAAATGLLVALHGANEVLDDRLMRARIGDHRRGRA